MARKLYEVTFKELETGGVVVFVEADDKEEAISFAIDEYTDGEAEIESVDEGKEIQNV